MEPYLNHFFLLGRGRTENFSLVMPVRDALQAVSYDGAP